MLSLNPIVIHVSTCCQQNYFCCGFLGSKLLQGWGRKDGSEDQILRYLGSTLTDAPKAFQNCDWVLAFIFEINIFNRCLRRPIQWRSGGQETGINTRISNWLWGMIFVWQWSLSQWSGMVYHILSIIIQHPMVVFNGTIFNGAISLMVVVNNKAGGKTAEHLWWKP